MKTIKEILYINEDTEKNRWYLSFEKPMFQGGQSFEISKEEAIRLNDYIHNSNTDISGNAIHFGDFSFLDRKIN